MTNSAFKPAAQVLIVTAVILSLPLIFKAPWTGSDYVVAAVLLLTTGTLFQLAVRKAGNIEHKAAAALAIGSGLALIWVDLAVGIVGDNEPINAVYLAVLAIEFLGAILVRFKPRGMARVLFATAGATALTGATALVLGQGEATQVAGVNGMFVILFSGAALLYWQVASAETRVKA